MPIKIGHLIEVVALVMVEMGVVILWFVHVAWPTIHSNFYPVALQLLALEGIYVVAYWANKM
jgi:hypothetical protein